MKKKKNTRGQQRLRQAMFRDEHPEQVPSWAAWASTKTKAVCFMLLAATAGAAVLMFLLQTPNFGETSTSATSSSASFVDASAEGIQERRAFRSADQQFSGPAAGADSSLPTEKLGRKFEEAPFPRNDTHNPSKVEAVPQHRLFRSGKSTKEHTVEKDTASPEKRDHDGDPHQGPVPWCGSPS